MKCELRRMSWNRLRHGTVDKTIKYFYELLMSLCKLYIPHEEKIMQKQSHPWLTQACIDLIARKNAAENTPAYEGLRDECARLLTESYKSYVNKLKVRISKLKKNDKQWWSLNRELLNKKAKTSSIPPLRSQDGTWITEPKAKAELFAQTWMTKCQLPAPVEDQYVARPETVMQNFIAFVHVM